ncbi:MAG: maleylpyruvate isomerase family mycothiol-dependent enzyme [Nocardioides sp.]|nr:maleylpyruvate isomerase family mycothiol-dependent enzyme [Nocardioides sp.]
MSDAERLAGYIDVWWQAINDFTTLLEELVPQDWAEPTDLPGWNVHDVAAHTAHLEAVLAGEPEETVEVAEVPHARGVMGRYTEQGVLARREHTPDELISEIRESATRRHTGLLADPPTVGTGQPSVVFGGMPWDWELLLRNRPLDVWMHEQDVRRATGRPGNLDTAPAEHTVDYMGEALGVIVGKRVAPPAGTTVVLAPSGSSPVAVEVGDDGRARPIDPPEDPTVRIELSREDFIVTSGGRRSPSQVAFFGERELGQQVIDSYRTTP